ncbi:hypothetical protein [Cellulomonas soli]
MRWTAAVVMTSTAATSAMSRVACSELGSAEVVEDGTGEVCGGWLMPAILSSPVAGGMPPRPGC